MATISFDQISCDSIVANSSQNLKSLAYLTDQSQKRLNCLRSAVPAPPDKINTYLAIHIYSCKDFQKSQGSLQNCDNLLLDCFGTLMHRDCPVSLTYTDNDP